jgi:hypothetical protein
MRWARGNRPFFEDAHNIIQAIQMLNLGVIQSTKWTKPTIHTRYPCLLVVSSNV